LLFFSRSSLKIFQFLSITPSYGSLRLGEGPLCCALLSFQRARPEEKVSITHREGYVIMIKAEFLEKAIAAHANWKARLRGAVGTGKFDVPASTVKMDSQCDFGKWLNGPDLTAAEKQTENYRAVKQLHAQFHQEAGRVIELAISGQKDAAEAAISMGGSYAQSSTKLTEAVVRWRQSL
jgi:hypothetical protein